MTAELFITCPENLELLLLEELRSLGLKDIRKGFRGVYAPVSMHAVYTANYCSRIATRVLCPLMSFNCRNRNDIYQAAREIPWAKFFKSNETFAIDANVTHPNLTNSLFAAQVMKDAICDQLREKTGNRPSVDVKNPNIQLNLFIHYNKGIISLDTSGAPLFKRGWRSATTSTSIQENLAAALLFQAGYNADTVLCDPFCGSGTFLIEAAMISTRTPAGYYRNQWGFFRLPQFDQAEWESFKKEKDALRIPLEKGKIFGADKDLKTLQACKDHVRKIGCTDSIALQHADIIRYAPPVPPTLILTDPPYGKRLETSHTIFKELGEFIKRVRSPSTITFVLAPDARYLDASGIGVYKEFPFSHGGLSVSAFQLNRA
ncbi:MAG: 50S rRNA methyltransferase [Verrucomicrobia bacterium]|nr:50S rRNA methyltransferase [Verrucomicrobiota bacterium]